MELYTLKIQKTKRGITQDYINKYLAFKKAYLEKGSLNEKYCFIESFFKNLDSNGMMFVNGARNDFEELFSVDDVFILKGNGLVILNRFNNL